MLSLLLLSAALQSAPVPERPRGEPNAIGRNLWSPPSGCDGLLSRAAEPIRPGGGLAWREGDEPVGMYLLLERRVRGCPAPIVVMERVPGSNAFGREMGRSLNLDQRPRP